jgi:RimJ/RimL family protein N-acetyltransferase
MVTLRPIASSDAAAVVAAVKQSRDALRRWMPWYRDDYDLQTAEEWIASSLESTLRGTAQQFVILDDRQDVVGVIGLEDIDDQSGRAMIGYWLATPASGRQVGRRAIEHAVAWARLRQSLHTIWAVVAEPNLASRRVLEINGFRQVAAHGIDERGDLALIYELDLASPPIRVAHQAGRIQ